MTTTVNILNDSVPTNDGSHDVLVQGEYLDSDGKPTGVVFPVYAGPLKPQTSVLTTVYSGMRLIITEVPKSK
jgi:hypothetical protein